MSKVFGFPELEGIDEYLLEDLPRSQKDQLITVISRISERAFRRGFQHGELHGAQSLVTPYDLRWKYSCDHSPYTNRAPKGWGITAIQRLKIETNLELIGLDFEADIPNIEAFEPKFK